MLLQKLGSLRPCYDTNGKLSWIYEKPTLKGGRLNNLSGSRFEGLKKRPQV